MAFSFMRFSKWKSKSAISVSFYVQRQKPELCDLFVICGGKLVFLREENGEAFIEDDQGVVVGRLSEKNSFRGWFGKMFTENASRKILFDSPSSSTSNESPNQWEKYSEQIDHYFNQLLSANAKEEGNSEAATANDSIVKNPPELNFPANMGTAEKNELLKIKIHDAQQAMQSNRTEAKTNADRYEKAKWAIGLCTSRADDLEARINQGNPKRMDIQKELDMTKEEVLELQSEVEEKKNKLNSILELQRELSNKLKFSSQAKSGAEIQLERAVRNRADMVQKIEELRRQRDVLQRRIEFCKEKDAIGMAKRLGDFSFDYRKFSAAEIRAATNNFSERLRLKSAGEWANVYRGRINQTTVAIKLSDSVDAPSQEAFQEKVKLLSNIRHPHILGIIGFCTELKCIVLEYMHHGCLRDILFSNPRSNNRRRNQGLNWHARIRIAAEVCIGLSFIHKTKPRPIIHGNLNPSKILLDQNNVAKIYGFKPCLYKDECDIRSDIRNFGSLLLQLLTGRNWSGLSEEALMMDTAVLTEALDKMAGEWPQDLAVELGGIAKYCLSIDENLDKEFSSKLLMRWVDKVRRKADELVANGDFAVAPEGDLNGTQAFSNAPSIFFCPIYKDVMKNPCLAADGYSYELEAIEEWLTTGHDTSPVTKLRLKNKLLIPNHNLRTLIQDCHNKRSIGYT